MTAGPMQEAPATDRALALQNLPETLVLSARFVALAPQRLPPIPTTALHGALGGVLKELCCVEPLRKTCVGCPQLSSACGFPTLFHPPGRPGAGEGVTDHAPPPLVFAPERFEPHAPYLRLCRGDAIDLRVVLIGPAALQRGLVVAALRDAARGGLGIDDTGGPRRPALELAGVEVLGTQGGGTPPARASLDLLTPLRLVREGHVSGRIDADLLWRTALRRADTLARLYGKGPIHDGRQQAAPFSITQASTRVVRVQRYSSRQQRRMQWPGVMGRLSVEGPELPAAWQVLQFIERVQLGKGTAFGLGRIRLGPT